MQLHKRDVVEAATAILDNYGIADLTMRRLGRELAVSPGALYWHFANKQELLGAVADRVLESVHDVSGDWRARIAGICGGLRDALLSHTDGAELVSSSFAAGQSRTMTWLVERLTDAAIDAGVDGAHGELVARTVVYYVLGFTADEQSRLQMDASGAALPDGQSVLADDPSARFTFGLQLLVEGVAAHSPADTHV
jgi:TetR/AcrR family transcriptional regulator, tetracycline repressor protein